MNLPVCTVTWMGCSKRYRKANNLKTAVAFLANPDKITVGCGGGVFIHGLTGSDPTDAEAKQNGARYVP